MCFAVLLFRQWKISLAGKNTEQHVQEDPPACICMIFVWFCLFHGISLCPFFHNLKWDPKDNSNKKTNTHGVKNKTTKKKKTKKKKKKRIICDIYKRVELPTLILLNCVSYMQQTTCNQLSYNSIHFKTRAKVYTKADRPENTWCRKFSHSFLHYLDPGSVHTLLWPTRALLSLSLSLSLYMLCRREQTC